MPSWGVRINDSDMVSPSMEVLCRDQSETISPYMEVLCRGSTRDDSKCQWGGPWGPSWGVRINDSDMVIPP